MNHHLTAVQIVVTIAAAGTAGLVVWFFWLKKTTGVLAGLTSSGYQEQMILVKGGYTPDTIRVRTGKPIRLVFRREESSPCSEQVLFDSLGKHASLPQGEPVAVELPPLTETGEHTFTCQMGMLRGTLIVEQA